MLRIIKMIVMGLCIALATACTDAGSSVKDADYDETKKMVVDILQTDDGKKALREILSDEQMKQNLVIESDTVQESIGNVLASDKGADMWTQLFNDPKFVKQYAESMSDEQQKLMKELMNDAEFQQQMLDLMQDTEINKQMLLVMNSQEFRSHLEDTIRETLETPTFQARIQEILLEAAEKQTDDKQHIEEDQPDENQGGESGEGKSPDEAD